MRLRVATRSSELARWQAEHIAKLLRAVDPSVEPELVLVDTMGDRQRDKPISEIGGKGVFAKEIQSAVLDGRADIAVHSAKDLPSTTPQGLVLAAVPERGDHRDVLLVSSLAELPEGGVVATGSLRRRVQLAHVRPDLRFEDLRGNVGTRIGKADQFDGVVLAAAGIDRLGLSEHIVERLPTGVMLPQVGQGALAVECRKEDNDTRALVGRIEHQAARRCVDAERGFLAKLGGDCSLPAAAHATLAGDCLEVEGIIASPDGRKLLRHEVTGPAGAGAALGRSLASHLLDEQGGAELLKLS